MKNEKTKKLALTALMTALSVTLSTMVVFPNMAPFQHFINVIGAVILGPYYNFICALLTGIIRMGMGKPFTSVTGAIFGALLSALLYRQFKSFKAAFVGEVIGTGIISAIVSYPFMKYVFGLDLPHPFYYIPFFIPSATIGAALGVFVLLAMESSGALKYALKKSN